MKKILVFLCALVPLSSFAKLNLSLAEQTKIVENVAKSERRHLWETGHQDVSSFVSKMKKSELDVKLKNNSNLEYPMNTDEVTRLKQCINQSEECSLFLIDIGASYMGGSGEINAYILLNPKTGKFAMIKHLIYEE